MESWRQQLLTDSNLSLLLDCRVPPEEVLKNLSTLPPDSKAKTYAKLASLKHLLYKAVQTKVEANYRTIQENLLNGALPEKDQQLIQAKSKLASILKEVHKYNQRYVTVQQNLQYWSNANKAMHFVKALDSFHTNYTLLTTLTKDKTAINCFRAAQTIKALTELCRNHDFSGISLYESARIQIGHARHQVYGQAEKQLIAKITHTDGIDPAEIIERLEVLQMLGEIEQFTSSLHKHILKEIQQQLRLIFKENTIRECLNLCRKSIMLQRCSTVLWLDVTLANQFNHSSSLLDKFWTDLALCFKELLRWVQQDQVSQPLSESAVVGNQVTGLKWKYPSLFLLASSTANHLHIEIIKQQCVVCEDFCLRKGQLVLSLVELSSSYYSGVKQALKLNSRAVLNWLLENACHDVICSQVFDQALEVCPKEWLREWLLSSSVFVGVELTRRCLFE